VALTLSHYRFGVDELAESTHGWHAAEDTDPAEGVIAVDTTFLLRFTVQANAAAGLTNVDNNFEFRLNGGTWTQITTSSSVVKAVAATALTNGGNCTKRLSGTGTFETTGAGQTEDGISGGTANDIVASGNSETECGLQIVGADVAGGDLIEFRLTRDAQVLLDTYSVVPSITIPLADLVATLAQTLAGSSVSATATVDVVASVAATLGGSSLAATAAVDVVASVGATLDGTSLAATATVEAAGTNATLAQTLEGSSASAAAAVEVAASVTQTLGGSSASSTATVDVTATAMVTLEGTSAAAAAAVDVTATVAATLGGTSLAATVAVDVEADVAATLAGSTVAAAAAVDVELDLAATLEGASLSATVAVGDVPLLATLAQTLQGTSGAAAAGVDVEAELGGVLGGSTVASTVAVEIAAAVAATLAGTSLAATVTVGEQGLEALPEHTAYAGHERRVAVLAPELRTVIAAGENRTAHARRTTP
jgi:hypothetical protein